MALAILAAVASLLCTSLRLAHAADANVEHASAVPDSQIPKYITDAISPCEFAQPPTNNHCEGVMAYHIREGAYGDVRVDDLSIIAVLWFDGNFWTKTKVTYGIFIDESADESQREAIQKVFSGQAGGFMAKMAGLIGEGRWIEYVPIYL